MLKVQITIENDANAWIFFHVRNKKVYFAAFPNTKITTQNHPNNIYQIATIIIKKSTYTYIKKNFHKTDTANRIM